MELKKLFLLTVLILGISAPFSAQNFSNRILGTWKVEGKDTYEHWDALSPSHLTGVGYRVRDEQIYISEYLELFRRGEKWIYTARVPSQNDGRKIEFEESSGGKDQRKFTNPTHDFPRDISYKFISDDRLEVWVSGEGGKGFQINFRRVEN